MEVGLLTEWPGNVLFHGNPARREPLPVFSRGNWEAVVVCETPGMAPSSPSTSLPSALWISGKCGAVPGLLWESQPGIQEPQDPQSCPRVTNLSSPRKPARDTAGSVESTLGPGNAETGKDPGGTHRILGWGTPSRPPVLTPVAGPPLPLQEEPGIPGDATGPRMEGRAGLELEEVWHDPHAGTDPWRGGRGHILPRLPCY